MFPAKDIDDQKILQSDWTRHILNYELNCSKITFVYFEIYHSLSEILITRILQWQWGLFKESSFFGPILGQKRIFREFKFCHFFVSKFLSLGKIKIKIKKKKRRKDFASMIFKQFGLICCNFNGSPNKWLTPLKSSHLIWLLNISICQNFYWKNIFLAMDFLTVLSYSSVIIFCFCYSSFNAYVPDQWITMEKYYDF